MVTLILEIVQPELAVSHDPAVVARAVIVVFLIPAMTTAHYLTVFALVSNAKADEGPRQVRANPRAPAIRMI